MSAECQTHRKCSVFNSVTYKTKGFTSYLGILIAGIKTLSFSSLSGISPLTASLVDARLVELQHYVQRESDALVLAKDVVKELEGISSLDRKALAEVGLSVTFILKYVRGERSLF